MCHGKAICVWNINQTPLCIQYDISLNLFVLLLRWVSIVPFEAINTNLGYESGLDFANTDLAMCFQQPLIGWYPAFVVYELREWSEEGFLSFYNFSPKPKKKKKKKKMIFYNDVFTIYYL